MWRFVDRPFGDIGQLLVSLPRGGVVAEVGVYQGAFSRKVLWTTFPEELHLIDPYTAEQSFSNTDPGQLIQAEYDRIFEETVESLSAWISDRVVVFHRGYSADVLRKFPNRVFDWVYIDGNHTFEGVSEDLRLSKDKVKRGGVICGDDYTSGNPVVDHRYGVVDAVDEFCREYEWGIIAFADKFWSGQNFRNYVLCENAYARFWDAYLRRAYRLRHIRSLRNYVSRRLLKLRRATRDE